MMIKWVMIISKILLLITHMARFLKLSEVSKNYFALLLFGVISFLFVNTIPFVCFSAPRKPYNLLLRNQI